MRKQREKLLELIRRLAEDDKEGVMAHKVINLQVKWLKRLLNFIDMLVYLSN